MTSKPMLAGFFFAITATILWSGNFIVARGLSAEIAPLSLAFWRWVVAILVLLPFAIKPVLQQWSWVKEHFAYLCIVSLLGVTLFNSLIYYAGQTSSAINLSLIAITFPIFILLLSRIFLSQAIGWNKLVGIVLVAAGILILISKGKVSVLAELTTAQGDIWMLFASLIFAIYSMLLKRKPVGIGVVPFQWLSFILGLIMLLPFYLLERYTLPATEFSASTIMSIIYIGVFASLLAFILWNKAIAIIGAVNAGMVYYSLPIFSGILAIIILDESFSRLHLYSMLLVLAGIVLAVVYNPRNMPVNRK